MHRILSGATAVLAAASAFGAVDTTSDAIAERALAQQGFAIALASNVLQSHVTYVAVAVGSFNVDGTCVPLDDTDNLGGGIIATAPGSNPGDSFYPHVIVTLYYDGACTKKYMYADVNVTQNGDTYSVSNLTNQYYAVDGVTPLVTLVTTASATLSDSAVDLHGMGTLTAPSGHSQAAQLGLVCAGGSDPNDNNLYCAGGIAQDFHSINTSLGSVSPLTLTPSSQPNDPSLSFASTSPGAFRSGGIGALTLGYTDATDAALKVTGGASYGSDAVVGSVAEFALLPPPPTGWTADDTAHDAHFAITVNASRSLAVTITRISTGAVRASTTLDQSGTGILTFSDDSKVEVRGWIIGDSTPDPIFRNGFE